MVSDIGGKVKCYVFSYFPDERYNTVPPLSDDRFFMTAPFVQDSTTYVMELNTKLEGKRILHWQSCLV